ncbi:hypothetical protein D1BOALGB6SA_10882 [Olavius sp. associated proteobacterium Delta 1]|nr:hypothetical protein D1BOALGB6SA_10882 [Olavius sp. associated proteobacterium Delta 1]
MRKEYDFSKGKRGPVIQPDPNKVRITIRLDADIVDYFKEQVHRAGGGNYQTSINRVLREYLDKKQAPLNEETLRRVIREELRATH